MTNIHEGQSIFHIFPLCFPWTTFYWCFATWHWNWRFSVQPCSDLHSWRETSRMFNTAGYHWSVPWKHFIMQVTCKSFDSWRQVLVTTLSEQKLFFPVFWTVFKKPLFLVRNSLHFNHFSWWCCILQNVMLSLSSIFFTGYFKIINLPGLDEVKCFFTIGKKTGA